MAQTNEEILLSNIVSNTASPITPFWIDNNNNYGKPSTFVTDFKKPSNFGASIPPIYDQMVIEIDVNTASSPGSSFFYTASIIGGRLPDILAGILADIDAAYSTSLGSLAAEVVDVKLGSEYTHDSLGATVRIIQKVVITANIWISE